MIDRHEGRRKEVLADFMKLHAVHPHCAPPGHSIQGTGLQRRVRFLPGDKNALPPEFFNPGDHISRSPNLFSFDIVDTINGLGEKCANYQIMR
jgi:hypothetical protein